MMELTCWCCGYEGRVRQRCVGRRVRCKRCRAETMVPDARTDEIFVAGWIAAIDEASESATVEVDILGRLAAV